MTDSPTVTVAVPANTVVTAVENAVTPVATTVVTTVKADATAEVTSLSDHWHIPVWAVIAVLAAAAIAVIHFVL